MNGLVYTDKGIILLIQTFFEFILSYHPLEEKLKTNINQILSDLLNYKIIQEYLYIISELTNSLCSLDIFSNSNSIDSRCISLLNICIIILSCQHVQKANMIDIVSQILEYVNRILLHCKLFYDQYNEKIEDNFLQIIIL